MRWILRSKIHKAIVTDVNKDYIGSIGIDKYLMEKVGFWEGEKVLVVDNTNGARAETYIIGEENKSGKITMYGAICHLIKKGDEVTIMGFELADKPIKSKSVLVDENNVFIRFL